MREMLAQLRREFVAAGSKGQTQMRGRMAIMLAGITLCGCEDKNLILEACHMKAQSNPVQIEKCMSEQGYVFSDSHLCAVSYPNVGAECYTSTWRAWSGSALRCLHPDENKCGWLGKPYLALPK
jgi:hypothetical protein